MIMTYLLYYTTKEGNKSWLMAKEKEILLQFVKENKIEDYGITVNDNSYEYLEGHSEHLEEKLDTIKTALEELI